MASTYTDAGIELIGVGEQSNTWGATTNTNWRLIEELATGVVSINLTGLTSYNLTTTDGVTSNGRHFVVEFTGAPGATCTVTVNPDDLQKVYVVNNATDQTITITQGSGGDVDVPVSSKKIVYCDGGGSGAKVTDVTENLGISGNIDVSNISATTVSAPTISASTTLEIGSTWSVREDAGVLYFSSASGDVLNVTADGTLTTSGEIVVE